MLSLFLIAAFTASCATESHKTVETQTVASYGTSYDGPRYALVISTFCQ